MSRTLPSLMVVTDGNADPESVRSAVLSAIEGGARLVQIRRHGRPASEVLDLCTSLRPSLRAVDGMLIVNDRVDVVAAGYADGVHLGFRSLSVADARRVLGDDPWIGASAHGREELHRAADSGADYATLSPVCPTSSHDEVTALGYRRAQELCSGSRLPVFWFGGMLPEDWEAATGVHGLAALSPFQDTERAGDAAREFLSAERAARSNPAGH